LVAHRRAGKTVAAINDLIRRAITEGGVRAQYAYIAPFRSQAKSGGVGLPKVLCPTRNQSTNEAT
jgi:hypothetical protein